MIQPYSFKHQALTTLVTVACIIIYGLEYIGFQDQIFELFHYPFYLDQDFELWRYISHTLVHLSEMHILFNLLWWWQFASLVERFLGTGKLVAIFLVAGTFSGMAQNMMSGPNFFGLSGVVYAVLAYVFALNRFTRPSPLYLPDSFLYSLLIGIGIGFISPLFGVHMGNTAHISGLLIGLVWGFIDAKRYGAVR